MSRESDIFADCSSASANKRSKRPSELVLVQEALDPAHCRLGCAVRRLDFCHRIGHYLPTGGRLAAERINSQSAQRNQCSFRVRRPSANFSIDQADMKGLVVSVLSSGYRSARSGVVLRCFCGLLSLDWPYRLELPMLQTTRSSLPCGS